MIGSRLRHWAACVLGASLVTSAAAAAAETRETASEPADAAAIMLAVACFNCHGTDGALRNDDIPAIAGAPQPVLQAQLLAFKQGQMPATVMDRIAGGFSDAELAILAAHFAAQHESAADEREQEAP